MIRDLCLRVPETFGGRWVRTKDEAEQIGILAREAIQLLEHREHTARVISGRVQGVQAEEIGLAFGFPRMSSEEAGRQKLRSRLPDACRSALASYGSNPHVEETDEELVPLRALEILEPMSRDDMPDLVSEDGRELALALHCREQSRVHVDVPAREREGVHRRILDDEEAIFESGTLRDAREPLSETLHVVGERPLVHEPLFLL